MNLINSLVFISICDEAKETVNIQQKPVSAD